MRFLKSEIAGMVTLYNSPPEVLENIKTYECQVDKLYVIDNSECPNPTLEKSLSKFSRILYLANYNNRGIAFALNLAARTALHDGYRFLLTMDDDSKPPLDLTKRMLSFLSTQDLLTIGIVSANHSFKKKEAIAAPVLYTMTSGNLLNLEAYRQVGQFCEELFIDHVDHEYGMRLNSHKFKVIELLDMHLEHKLGIKKEIRIFNRSYNFISHNPLRIYYMTRNGIYVALQYWRKYPSFMLTAVMLTSKEIVKTVLLESRKAERMKNIILGSIDGLLGRLGKKDK